MIDIEYLGNAGDGFMVHVAGQAPRFIEHHAFLSTFGIAAFEKHVLQDADVVDMAADHVTCIPARFPQFTVKWQRDSDGNLDPETGLVLLNGHPFTKVTSAPTLVQSVRDALNAE